MGGNQSIASSTIDNAISSSIVNVMENQVKASVNVACTNNQIVNGAKDCNITFADQLCTAVGTSNFAGTTTFNAETAQSIMNTITAKTDAVMSGLTPSVMNKSESTIVAKSNVSMTVDSAQKFYTDCTRDVRGINSQVVSDCGGSLVAFSPQMISATVIGDCVANASGTFKAVQDITNVVDVTATSSMKGVDMFGLMFLYLCYAIIAIIGGPMFVGRMKRELMSSNTTLTPDERQANKQRFVMVMVIMFVICVSLIVWWPGIIAAKLKVWPYSYPTVDVDYDPKNPGAGIPMCQDGKNLNRATFVNEFMWYDPLCLTTPEAPCTSQSKQKHYEACGVFATKSGCDDPQHTKDKAAFSAVLDACSELSVANAKPTSCDVMNVAYEAISTATTYGTCLKCDDERYGRANYWVKDSSGSCTVNRISERAYLKQPGSTCPVNDPNCRTTEAELLRDSPDECMDLLYQNDKRKLAYILGVCDKIQKVAALHDIDPETGQLPLLKYQCPPRAADYMLNCDEDSGKCSYTAVSADPYVIASCQNDLDGCCETDENGILTCKDENLQMDMDIYNHWNKVCADRWTKAAKLSLAAIITACIYVILFTIMIMLIMRAPVGNGTTPNTTNQFGQVVRPDGTIVGGPQSIATKASLCFTFFVMFWVCGAPFGILGYTQATPSGKMSIHSVYKSNPKSDYDKNTAWWFGMIGMCICGLISFGLLLSIIYISYKNSNIQSIPITQPVQQPTQIKTHPGL